MIQTRADFPRNSHYSLLSEIPKTPFQFPPSIRSMWNNRRPPEDGSDRDKDNSDQEKNIAKAAGFVVVSGIAMSILKALNPFNNQNVNCKTSEVKATVFESAPPQTQLQQCQPEPELIVKVVYLYSCVHNWYSFHFNLFV